MKEAEYGWYGAGWASFKGDKVAEIHMPPDESDALKEWLDGFLAAHADYPDDEAMESIMNGDGTGGEPAESDLLRIAPDVYVMVSERKELIDEYGFGM